MHAPWHVTHGVTGRRPTSIAGRSFGFGSVFGKTVRDSRIGATAVACLLGGLVLLGGASMMETYGTPATRLELRLLTTSLPPIMVGLYGNPVNVDTLGGFLTWHYGAYLSLLAGLWSILALASTLAGEAERGSLEFAVAAPISRLRLASEKVAGHVVALAIAVAAVGTVAWLTGAIFARLPGDAIPVDAAAAFAVGLGLRALIAGSVAFAVAAALGRGAGIGVAGAVMLGGYVLTAYRRVVPAFDTVADVSWFAWTADHLPLAGRTDWVGVAAAAIACTVLLGFGIVAFCRRDIGVRSALRTPALPAVVNGVSGPFSRSFADVLPTAVSWGIGLGLYGLVMAAASRAFVDEVRKAPAIGEMLRQFGPGFDMATVGGFLQLLFIDFGLVLAGLAAASLVAERLGDEAAGRLELRSTTPLSRVRWSVADGVGVWLGIAVVTACIACAVALGVAAAGGDVAVAAVGTLALAAYGIALSGFGLAIGGLVRGSLAGPAVAILALGTFLVDVFGPVLDLPGWVRQLSLSTHMGQPMVGSWDPIGLLACAVMALGGLALGAWGMGRRDLAA